MYPDLADVFPAGATMRQAGDEIEAGRKFACAYMNGVQAGGFACRAEGPAGHACMASGMGGLAGIEHAKMANSVYINP